MGNDGGSIPKRHELVKTKTARSRDSDAALTHQQWAYCALSKLPLRAPVVACPLGRMYNKDALIAHLLAPSPLESPYGMDGHQTAGHIRSLRDVVTLRLTPNPALSPSADKGADDHATLAGAAGATDQPPPAAFVCPVSLREMNGSVRFVYRVPCGCVVSDSALRELRRVDPASLSAADEGRRVCPVDGAEDAEGATARDERWVPINPKGEEAQRMLEAWDAQKQRERDDKKAAKAKKRKAVDAAVADGDEAAAASEKKARKKDAAKLEAAKAVAAAHAPAVKAGASVPKLSATLAAKLADDKRKQSPAIASLYAKKGEDEMRVRSLPPCYSTLGPVLTVECVPRAGQGRAEQLDDDRLVLAFLRPLLRVTVGLLHRGAPFVVVLSPRGFGERESRRESCLDPASARRVSINSCGGRSSLVPLPTSSHAAPVHALIAALSQYWLFPRPALQRRSPVPLALLLLLHPAPTSTRIAPRTLVPALARKLGTTTGPHPLCRIARGACARMLSRSTRVEALTLLVSARRSRGARGSLTVRRSLIPVLETARLTGDYCLLPSLLAPAAGAHRLPQRPGASLGSLDLLAQSHPGEGLPVEHSPLMLRSPARRSKTPSRA